jgi:hypothetical protein
MVQITAPDDDGDADDLLQDHIGFLPIYSARLRAALRDAGVTGIQYLPAQVFQSGNVPVEGYAIGNILDVIPALDLAKSRYSLFGDSRLDRKGEIFGLRKVVVRGAGLEGYDIVRLKEYPLYICVSQRFKDKFEAGGFTGYAFEEIEVS